MNILFVFLFFNFLYSCDDGKFLSSEQLACPSDFSGFLLQDSSLDYYNTSPNVFDSFLLPNLPELPTNNDVSDILAEYCTYNVGGNIQNFFVINDEKQKKRSVKEKNEERVNEIRKIALKLDAESNYLYTGAIAAVITRLENYPSEEPVFRNHYTVLLSKSHTLYQCSICNKYCAKKVFNVTRHLKTHCQKVKCPLCVEEVRVSSFCDHLNKAHRDLQALYSSLKINYHKVCLEWWWLGERILPDQVKKSENNNLLTQKKKGRRGLYTAL